MSDDTPAAAPTEKPRPRITIRFLYQVTDDLAATRAFYTDVLGMEEAHFMDEEQWGWVVYQCDGLQMMFFRSDTPVEDHPLWDFQPGDGGDDHTGERMSFSLFFPWDDYRAAVARVAASDARTMTDKPTWRQTSYWGWTVKSPKGRTIEIYSDPPEQPAEGETPVWQD